MNLADECFTLDGSRILHIPGILTSEGFRYSDLIAQDSHLIPLADMRSILFCMPADMFYQPVQSVSAQLTSYASFDFTEIISAGTPVVNKF